MLEVKNKETEENKNRKAPSLSALIAPNICKLESPVCVQRQVQEGCIFVISCQGSNEQCLLLIQCTATFQGVKCQSVHFLQATLKQHCQGLGCKQKEKRGKTATQSFLHFTHYSQSECGECQFRKIEACKGRNSEIHLADT